MIRTQKVTKDVISSKESLSILHEIDITIDAGEAVAIVGSSGSGKSTLLGLLAGLDLPSSGAIYLNDQDITQFNEDQRAELRAELVGFVFQSFHLLPGLTALENVMLAIELKGGSGAKEQAASVLCRVGLEERLHHYPKQLSGGEQQRVAIARAFCTKPKILFADEPTGNLDTGTGAKVIDLLFDLNQEQGTTLVLVTHEQRLAARCQRSIRLESGRVVDVSFQVGA